LSKNANYIKVGLLNGAYGVVGHFRLTSFCKLPESIFAYQPFYLENDRKELNVQVISKISDGFRVKSKTVKNKEEADKLKGQFVYCLRNKFPDLPEDEFYFSDLIGLEVRNINDIMIGRIKRIEDYGGGAILEIYSKKNDSILVPFTKEIVPTVDLKSKIIVVNLRDKNNQYDGPKK